MNALPCDNEAWREAVWPPFRLLQKLPAEVRHSIVKTLIGLGRIDRRFTGGRDVFRAGVLQGVFRSLDFIRRVAVNRKQDRAFLKVTFVALGLIFRNAQADERSGESAD